MKDDLIRKAKAIDLLYRIKNGLQLMDDTQTADKVMQGLGLALTAISKMSPERKKGKWMYTDASPHRVYCSECYKTYIPNKEWYAWVDNIVPRNFCPNCGAEMEADQ